MADGPGPISTGLAKIGQLAYMPFNFPMNFTNGGRLMGNAAATVTGGISGSIAQALGGLDPKGPLRWAAVGAARVAEATGASEARANEITGKYWTPASEAAQTVGAALVGPLTWPFLKKAGQDISLGNIKATLGASNPVVSRPEGGSNPPADGGAAGGEPSSQEPAPAGDEGASPEAQGGVPSKDEFVRAGLTQLAEEGQIDPQNEEQVQAAAQQLAGMYDERVGAAEAAAPADEAEAPAEAPAE